LLIPKYSLNIFTSNSCILKNNSSPANPSEIPDRIIASFDLLEASPATSFLQSSQETLLSISVCDFLMFSSKIFF